MNDFLVIGGGIAGVSAGARLSALGRVTLLEAEEALAYHTSGRSAALFEETYGLPSTRALNRASRDFLISPEVDVLSPRGFLLVSKPDELDLFRDELASMALSEISVAEAQEMIPIIDDSRVSHAAFDDGAQDIDTGRLIDHFAATLRAAGGRIVTRARVARIDKTGAGWTVETEKGDQYEARVLVNAAGSWADQVAQMAGIAPLGLTPLKRSVARVAAPEGQDIGKWPILFGPGETWYAKPDAGALIISPADEEPSTPHDAWAEDMVLAEGIARYEDHVTHRVTRMVANWAGLRTFAPDRQLVLGFAPGRDDFLWSAGQGGYGFQTSAAASQLVADIAGGRASDLPDDIVAALSPARFA